MEKRANLTIGLAVGHSSCQWLSSSPAPKIHFSQCGAGSVLWGMCSLKLSAERIQSVLHVASMSLPKMPKQNDESTGCKPKNETQQHCLQASRKNGQQLPKLALDPKLFHFKLSPPWNGSLVISRIAVIVVIGAASHETKSGQATGGAHRDAEGAKINHRWNSQSCACYLC